MVIEALDPVILNNSAQNLEVNRVSRSEIILAGIPWCFHQCWTNSFATSSAADLVLPKNMGTSLTKRVYLSVMVKMAL